MNKKILIINGSPRKDGYTSVICKELLEILKNEEIKLFDTYSESVSPCLGCNYCKNSGKCVKRDLDDFYNAFEEADEIFFLSPIYNGTFPGPLKNLIDRFQVYFNSFYKNNKTQPIEKRRKAYFVAVAGRNGEKSFEYMKWQLKCAFSILNIEFAGAFLLNNTDENPSAENIIKTIERSLADDKR